MTTHDDLDYRLKTWFDAEARGRLSGQTLESVLDATRGRQPRPAWAVALRGGVYGAGLRRPERRTLWPIPLVATVSLVLLALLVGLIAGAASKNPRSDASPSARPVTIGTFHATGSMVTADKYGRFDRFGQTATLLLDGRVLIAGGSVSEKDAQTPGLTGNPLLASAEIYDPRTGTFTATGLMATARAHHTATLLADGRVLITGGGNRGYFGGGYALASAEIYDPATGKFSSAGSMGTPRIFATATRLKDGRVLIARGWGNIANPNDAPPLVSAELYDPATGAFSPTGSAATGHYFGTATGLDDGRVLLLGYSPQAVEIYDPVTQAFGQPVIPGPLGSETSPISSATTLADGRVLLVGALGGPQVDDPRTPYAELYDPTSGLVTPTGRPLIGDGTSPILLSDGRVLFIGNTFEGPAGTIVSISSEVYDPEAGTFSLAPGTSRRAFTATPLLDGRVLVVGGAPGSEFSATSGSAEIFQ